MHRLGEAVGCSAGQSITARTNRAQGGSKSLSSSQIAIPRMYTATVPNSLIDATDWEGTNRKPFSGTVSVSCPRSMTPSVRVEIQSGSASPSRLRT